MAVLEILIVIVESLGDLVRRDIEAKTFRHSAAVRRTPSLRPDIEIRQNQIVGVPQLPAGETPTSFARSSWTALLAARRSAQLVGSLYIRRP